MIEVAFEVLTSGYIIACLDISCPQILEGGHVHL